MMTHVKRVFIRMLFLNSQVSINRRKKLNKLKLLMLKFFRSKRVENINNNRRKLLKSRAIRTSLILLIIHNT